MSKLGIIELSADRSGLRRYVRFPFSLYRGNPNWVPPLVAEEVRGLDPQANPVFQFTDAAYWIAERNGEELGRVAGFVNRRDNERRGRRAARFGMIDFVDDSDVSGALLSTVEEWSRSLGMDELEGPLGPGHFDRNCVLIEGFDELPTAISCYNYPYYSSHIEARGYCKELDYLEHRVVVAPQPDARVAKLSQYVLRRKGLALWEATSKREMLGRAREVFDLINTAYSELHDFVPLTDDEIQFLIGQFFSFIDRRYIKVVVDRDGAIVAVGIGMESVSRALQRARGKLWPLGWLRIWREMRKNDVLDLYLVAVRPDLQGAGLNAILMHEMHKTAIERGLHWVETNGELETNRKVLTMWKGYEYRTHKRCRIYSKRL